CLLALVCLLASPCLIAAQEQTTPKWYDVRTLTVEGRGWSDTAEFFDRLPARAEKLVRPEVWRLSRNSAGMSIRFVTDADSISVRWRLRSPNLALPNMTATGVSGVDLYVKDKGMWRWAASGKADKPVVNEQKIISNMSRKSREYRLYLPLYNGVESVELGLPPNAFVTPAKPFPVSDKPIVFYGTSIVQGASASRPGIAYPSILGRRLNRPVINLGFSGNGRMESEVAQLLVDLDAAGFVIDCLPNLSTGSDVTERTPKLVRILREKRPHTPIILVENIQYPDIFIETNKNKVVREKNAALRKVYKELISAGVSELYYVSSANLIGSDGEATIDGVHPTDLGFVRMANIFEPILRRILRQK
ncbi:MAG TPA: SGNH/GDSL hydrolase family protein, partial [Pyrinomonadaceae bacterium]|nr:SGNH/GDSL hydrolase family protein [Pyrinomonadaceae bacterium]